MNKESSKMQTKLLFDTSSLITAAQFGISGQFLIQFITDYAQTVIPEGVKLEAVDLGLQTGYSDALELDRIESHPVAISNRFHRAFTTNTERSAVEMTIEIAVPVDEKISKYVQALAQSERESYSNVLRALLEEGYKREIEKLHASYARGEITLRGMARRLGLNYRELYQLLADKGLPL